VLEKNNMDYSYVKKVAEEEAVDQSWRRVFNDPQAEKQDAVEIDGGQQTPVFVSDDDDDESPILERTKTRRCIDMIDEDHPVHSYELEAPSLEKYFGTFGVSRPVQIALCRTYANYLAQKERSLFKE